MVMLEYWEITRYTHYVFSVQAINIAATIFIVKSSKILICNLKIKYFSSTDIIGTAIDI